jgi:Glycosyl hydrolase catalytic core
MEKSGVHKIKNIHRRASQTWKAPMGNFCVVRLLLLFSILLVDTRQAAASNAVGKLLNGKKGVALTMRPIGRSGSWLDNIPKLIKLNATWNYSWGPTRRKGQPESIDFLPMIWGYDNNPNNLKEILGDILKLEKPKILLGFNEPDNEVESNIPVYEALNAWPILESANVPLVSPSCVDASGDWMTTFMTEALERQYRVDIIGVHYYGGPDLSLFQDILKSLYKTYQKPIMVTEFAPADWQAESPEENRYSPREVLEFVKDVLPWMESQDWIVGYSWFNFEISNPVGTSSALFKRNGDLTALGKYYADWQGTQRNIFTLNQTQGGIRLNATQHAGDSDGKDSVDWSDLQSVPWIGVSAPSTTVGKDAQSKDYRNTIQSAVSENEKQSSADWGKINSPDWRCAAAVFGSFVAFVASTLL